ncbi:hypothetical protein THAOC_29595 [Thalassiosira oceanica]|uniref:Uncharacterized protein n=1 Tax=Thalassiosira oceanica TaxID=159749 RepID=K0RDI3_THAOC|nr:hypothetical protein THAOC_29595 [Thalassiosira oceanica]|eukprot:EJK51250.1 hypothetical protein THAOC_29595 [Thalassiosira oceanica]
MSDASFRQGPSPPFSPSLRRQPVLAQGLDRSVALEELAVVGAPPNVPPLQSRGEVGMDEVKPRGDPVDGIPQRHDEAVMLVDGRRLQVDPPNGRAGDRRGPKVGRLATRIPLARAVQSQHAGEGGSRRLSQMDQHQRFLVVGRFQLGFGARVQIRRRREPAPRQQQNCDHAESSQSPRDHRPAAAASARPPAGLQKLCSSALAQLPSPF